MLSPGFIGGGTGRPGQEGTITFSNSWGEAKIYGFDLPFNFFTATDHEATFAIAKQTDIYSLIDC
jgi:hypothetical protein